MQARKNVVKNGFVFAAILSTVLCFGMLKGSAREAAGQAAAKLEPKSTLEGLQMAYDGESNASAKYLAFAKKADAEGYGRVASLFRAASVAEGIHAAGHAKVIAALGGKPNADIKKAEVKSTKENLQAAIAGETYEFTEMYPVFIAKAREEQKRDAVRSFNRAMNVEKAHAKLYQEALDNLSSWKGPNQEFFVCSVCGNTVAVIDFEKCPVCFEPKSDYKPVK
jgi:rubrerythrin